MKPRGFQTLPHTHTHFWHSCFLGVWLNLCVYMHLSKQVTVGLQEQDKRWDKSRETVTGNRVGWWKWNDKDWWCFKFSIQSETKNKSEWTHFHTVGHLQVFSGQISTRSLTALWRKAVCGLTNKRKDVPSPQQLKNKLRGVEKFLMSDWLHVSSHPVPTVHTLMTCELWFVDSVLCS